MAYEVTATRRRPKRFEDMVGQDFVVATLQKSIAAGKIAHAYLFSGPRGCGKTSSARILARALNCEQGPSATPCGTCSACTEIARGSSLDVIEIDGASNTSVNDVRQIKDEVQFPPNSCRYKVYIIDEVHMLSTSAFNALLKTIEEPPPYVIFIFATTELHKVPATIKSRCQQFNFRLVPVELLKTVLAEAAGESGINADEEALFWIAREATGSVRDAYTLFDQVAAFSDGHITYEKIRDKLGLVGVERINPVIEACAEKRAHDALSALDSILQNGVSIEQFTVDVADYFRSLLLIRNGITKESLLGQSADRFSARVLELWSPVQIERALGLMLQLFRDIRYSLDPRYELELVVSRLSWISDYVSSADMKAAIVQARGLLMKGAGPTGTIPAKTEESVRGAAQNAPGGSGPFSEADRFDVSRETVRENSVSSGSFAGDDSFDGAEPPVSDDGVRPEEEKIANPFAAFKDRLNAGTFGSGKTQSSTAAIPVSSPVSVPLSEQPAPSVVPEIQPGVSHIDTLPDSVSAPVQSSAETAAEPVPFSALPESLVAFFQASKNMVATGLSQATGWREEGTTVHFSVDKPFMHNFLEQDHKAIAEAASLFLGRAVGIEIHLDSSRQGAAANGNQGVPTHVEMIRHMFRGTLVGEG
jgi:DNA polymerase-3 subunit gamma/tau